MQCPTASIIASLQPFKAHPERILLIRPSALGDVARTVPVLSSLRAAFPAARIDWLVQQGFEGAIAAHPGLTMHGGRAILFDRKRYGRWHSPAAQSALLRFIRSLRRTRYDLAIDAQGLLRSGLLTLASGAPVRVGFADAREGGSLGLTQKVQTDPSAHTVARMLALLHAIGVQPINDLRLYVDPTQRDTVVNDPRFSANRTAVLAPTSRWPGKQWPDQRYTLLADALLKSHADTVVIVGGPGEQSQVPALCQWAEANRARAVNLIGSTTVPELMAHIARASILIGSDSAAVHLAVGLATPTVALYGPTDTARVGPAPGSPGPVKVVQFTTPGETLTPGMHKSLEPGRTMMDRITADQVIAACRDVLPR